MNGQTFRYDGWLSSYLGYDAYHCDYFPELTIDTLPNKKSFIDVKTPVDKIRELHHLQSLGFRLIETNITFYSSKFREHKSEPKVVCRFAESGDELAIRNISEISIVNSRFHRDPCIPREVAIKLKSDWVGNYFTGKRGNWMVVALLNSRVIGFLQLIQKDEKNIIIDLIAVDGLVQSNGAGSSMIHFAYENCLSRPFFQAGTQALNYGSMHFYISMGFTIQSAAYVSHLHKE